MYIKLHYITVLSIGRPRLRAEVEKPTSPHNTPSNSKAGTSRQEYEMSRSHPSNGKRNIVKTNINGGPTHNK